jgi:hypothetical protein
MITEPQQVADALLQIAGPPSSTHRATGTQ